MRSTRPRLLLAALAASAALFPGTATGQEEPERRAGFWMSAGGGGGLDSRSRGVVAGHVRGGATLSPHVLVGGDVSIFGQELDTFGASTRTSTIVNVGATLRFYPWETIGLYLNTGAAASFAHITVEEAGDVLLENDANGVALALGAGYDIRPGGGKLVLTPGVDLMVAGFDDGSALGYTLFSVAVGFR